MLQVQVSMEHCFFWKSYDFLWNKGHVIFNITMFHGPPKVPHCSSWPPRSHGQWHPITNLSHDHVLSLLSQPLDHKPSFTLTLLLAQATSSWDQCLIFNKGYSFGNNQTSFFPFPHTTWGLSPGFQFFEKEPGRKGKSFQNLVRFQRFVNDLKVCETSLVYNCIDLLQVWLGFNTTMKG